MRKIVAQSTPVGRSAIAVLRMSGEGVKAALKPLFKPFPTNANQLRHGVFDAGNGVRDDAMLVYFDAPKSFTGEEMAELYLHGGVVIVREVLRRLLSVGFEIAQNGEFTKRAFLNGKTNLSKAEGLIDIIDAESVAGLKAAESLAADKLGKKTDLLQSKLTEALARVEAVLDYPEEDLEQDQIPPVKTLLLETAAGLQNLLDTATKGRTAKYGVRIALCGEPNAGKSSLLNALVGFDRAIVSDKSGTTRDTLESDVEYKGIKMTFIDTAGIRETDDDVERQGVLRAKRAIQTCDVAVLVSEGKSPVLPDDCRAPVVTVLNKCDKTEACEFVPDIVLSAKTGKNVEQLKQKIYDLMSGDQVISADLLVTNARHEGCLTRAAESVAQALKLIDDGSTDILAAEIRQAWEFLGQITGKCDGQTVVDEIFSRFCLGK